MKSLIKFSILAVTVFLLSSCAMHNGYMNNSASLSEANFSYVDQKMCGSSKTVKVFGIGGSGKDALVDEAKNEMLGDIELLSNQALANVTVSWKNTGFIIWTTTKCTVTADIVEFTN